MTQYCRYCSFCIDGDALYCTDHDEVLTDKKVRQVNHCKDFALSPVGDVFTGRQYQPRKGKPLTAYDGCEQLELNLGCEQLELNLRGVTDAKLDRRNNEAARKA